MHDVAVQRDAGIEGDGHHLGTPKERPDPALPIHSPPGGLWGWTHISGEMRLGELPKMQGAACAKAGLGLCSEMCYLHATQEHPEPALPSLGEAATR